MLSHVHHVGYYTSSTLGYNVLVISVLDDTLVYRVTFYGLALIKRIDSRHAERKIMLNRTSLLCVCLREQLSSIRPPYRKRVGIDT